MKADKENIRHSRWVKDSKSVPKPGSHSELPPAIIQETKPPRRSRPLQSKLNNPKLLIQHPVSNHIAKSNLYNDESWIGQQQQLFTAILNEILESQSPRSSTWDDGDLLEQMRKTAF